jgi:Protein of unknown function (DUF3489)
MAKLSDAQLVVLSAACQRPDRCVFPVTAKLKGNAAGNVLKSLLNKGLIKEVRAKRDDTVWRHDKERGRMTLSATRAAFAALGIDPREVTSEAEPDEAATPSNDVEAAPTETQKAPKTAEPKPRRTRNDSKQAQLIAMLKRSKGASIDEIVAAFRWQAHTVRGAIAGALKKKLGLDVTSDKVEGRGRVYRITG